MGRNAGLRDRVLSPRSTLPSLVLAQSSCEGRRSQGVGSALRKEYRRVYASCGAGGCAGPRVSTTVWNLGGEGEARNEAERGAYSEGAGDVVLAYDSEDIGWDGVSRGEIQGFREEAIRDFAPQAGKEAIFYVTTGRKP